MTVRAVAAPPNPPPTMTILDDAARDIMGEDKSIVLIPATNVARRVNPLLGIS